MRRAAGLTTIAVVLAASTQANAADAITLTLGGRIKEFFFVASQTQAPAESLNSTGMFNDTRISVDGRTVLDNGITVRAFVRCVGRVERTKLAVIMVPGMISANAPKIRNGNQLSITSSSS